MAGGVALRRVLTIATAEHRSRPNIGYRGLGANTPSTLAVKTRTPSRRSGSPLRGGGQADCGQRRMTHKRTSKVATA